MSYSPKTRNTHRVHTRWYANKGVFALDYNCPLEALDKALESEKCSVCQRSYASMAEGKTGCVSNPQWHKTLHIWKPDWIIVCRVCHPKLEGKPANEWK
jgi:hypothetical protein